MSNSSTPPPDKPEPIDLDRAREPLERAERFLSRAQTDVRRALESEDPTQLFEALRELDEIVGPSTQDREDPERSSDEQRRSA